jgi:hypothetical protein
MLTNKADPSKIILCSVRFQVLEVADMKFAVFWDLTQRNLAFIYQRFGGNAASILIVDCFLKYRSISRLVFMSSAGEILNFCVLYRPI